MNVYNVTPTHVSNPFKTGRYCVDTGDAGDRMDFTPCFKPLQNGAVLRSKNAFIFEAPCADVSNPFKTGRYCVGLL